MAQSSKQKKKERIKSPYRVTPKISTLLSLVQEIGTKGMPTSNKNTFIEGEGFTISMNPTAAQGQPETAIVDNTGKAPHKYLILNGNYLKEYRPIVKKGYKAIVDKYKELLTKGADHSIWSGDYEEEDYE